VAAKRKKLDYSWMDKVRWREAEPEGPKLLSLDCPEKALLVAVALRAAWDAHDSHKEVRREATAWLRSDGIRVMSLAWIAQIVSSDPDLFCHRIRLLAESLRTNKAKCIDLDGARSGARYARYGPRKRRGGARLGTVNFPKIVV
jgi:hypothetical protein